MTYDILYTIGDILQSTYDIKGHTKYNIRHIIIDMLQSTYDKQGHTNIDIHQTIYGTRKRTDKASLKKHILELVCLRFI